MQLVTHKRRVALCCAALAMAGTRALAAHGNPNGTNWTNHNMDFLQADERSCGACRADLNDAIAAARLRTAWSRRSRPKARINP